MKARGRGFGDGPLPARLARGARTGLAIPGIFALAIVYYYLKDGRHPGPDTDMLALLLLYVLGSAALVAILAACAPVVLRSWRDAILLGCLAEMPLVIGVAAATSARRCGAPSFAGHQSSHRHAQTIRPLFCGERVMRWLLTVAIALPVTPMPRPASRASAATMASSGPGCRVPTTNEISRIQRDVTGTDANDSTARAHFFLPKIPADSVTVVSDTSICNRAALAVGRALSPPDTTILQPVAVIRVGGTRYVVTNEVPGRGEWMDFYVFDATLGAPLKVFLM